MKRRYTLGLLCYIPLLISAQSSGLLWKLYAAGKRDTSYLYGTIHIREERVFAFEKNIFPYLNQCQAVFLEIDPFRPFPNSNSLDKTFQNKKGIREQMIPEIWQNGDSLFRAKTGQSLLLFNHVCPIFLLPFILEWRQEKDSVTLRPYNLDYSIGIEAKKRNKKVYGLESAEEQIKMLQSIPAEIQIHMLEDALTEKENPSMDELIGLYLSGNTERLLAWSNTMQSYSSRTDKKLRVHRNRRMSQRMFHEIKRGGYFFAVGALHLPGEDGIIQQLRQKGVKLENILLTPDEIH